MKAFPLQTSPLHRTTTPVSPQVLTKPRSLLTLQTLDEENHTSLFPLDHLCLQFCSSFAEVTSQGSAQHTQKQALPMQPLERRGKLNIVLWEFSTAIWYLYFLKSGSSFASEISLLRSLLGAWLMDSSVGTDYKKVGVCPLCAKSVHRIFQWKMGKIKAKAKQNDCYEMGPKCLFNRF